jgi:hypothetical protein
LPTTSKTIPVLHWVYEKSKDKSSKKKNIEANQDFLAEVQQLRTENEYPKN